MSEESKGEFAPEPIIAPEPKVSQIPEEALKARLDRERGVGERNAIAAIAAKLGMDPDSAVTAIEEYRKIQDSQKTEQQRLLEQLDALKPTAARADRLEKRIAELSAVEYDGLTEEQKAHVDDLAQDGDVIDHEQRLKVIASMRRRGMTAQAKAPEPKSAIEPGSSTSRAGTGPKPVAEPEANTPAFHLRRFDSLRAGSVLANAYYNDHMRDIESARSQPKTA